MDNPINTPAILSLCTGIGGLEKGIERIIGPVRTLAFVEIEAIAIENLVQQMEKGVLGAAPVWTDLKTFPSEHFYRKIHGITGGYPCQPFSLAGRRKGIDDPRHLWPHIRRITGTIKPVWCFFENVVGHLELGYKEVRSDLESLGFTVKEGIFSAAEVGATHQRKRLFILAVRMENATNFRFKWGIKEEGKQAGTLSIAGTGSMANNNDSRELQQKRIIKEFRKWPSDGSKEMADASQFNVQGDQPEIINQKEWPEQGERSVRPQSTGNRWPAGPGEPQHDWESPRLKSRVGFRVNGYNFREDILRMAGNAVVEQVAAKAFYTLLKSMGLI